MRQLRSVELAGDDVRAILRAFVLWAGGGEDRNAALGVGDETAGYGRADFARCSCAVVDWHEHVAFEGVSRYRMGPTRCHRIAVERPDRFPLNRVYDAKPRPGRVVRV